MNLLKIGSLNVPSSRWKDSLEVFDNIYHLSLDSNDISIGVGLKPMLKGNLRLALILFKKLDFAIVKIIGKHTKLRTLMIKLYAVILAPWLGILEDKKIDCMYISYHDFDDSSFLHLIFISKIKNWKVIRGYKESRPGFDSVEYASLSNSEKIIVTSKKAQDFFMKKYKDFSESKFIIGLDEDWRSKRAAKICSSLNVKKLSNIDGSPHFVILAGTIHSDMTNHRNGARLYYLPMIEKILAKGWHVHIHVMRILPDSRGVNVYKGLMLAYPDLLHFEESLNFEKDDLNSYGKLAEYDFGIMHNWIEGHPTTEFDKTNIAHRFYEYLYAGVYPVVESFQSEIINEAFPFINNISLDELLELGQPQKNYSISVNIEYSFEEYIRKLYNLFQNLKV